MSEFAENAYKPDFELLDRYVSYSAELMRLSLLGITAISVLFLLDYKEHVLVLATSEKLFLFLSFAFFCVAIAFSLMHRFIATDSMAFHIAFLRKNEPQKKEQEREGRNARLKKSGKLLLGNAIFFALGILFLVLAVILVSLQSQQDKAVGYNPGDDGKIEIDFVQVNDVYEIAPLNEGETGGMARVANLKRECLSRNENTMLVMAGDFVSPSVYNNIKKNDVPVAGMQMIDAMNAAGFDLAVFGNHEFDINERELQNCIDESNFQWIASNTFYNDGKRSKFKKNNSDIPRAWKKTFIDKDGTTATVGFIGLTISSNPAKYVDYDTTLGNVKNIYDELEASCDAIVALTHLSMEQDMALAKKLPRLTAILGGHEHDMQFKKVGNVFVTKAHSNAKSAFIVNIVINKKNKSVTTTPKLTYLDSAVGFDPLTNAVVHKWASFANDYFRSSGFHIDSIIYRKENLDGRDEQVRRDSSNNFAKIVVRAMESACPNANLAVFNAGSIRVDEILKTPITQYDILRSLPFGGSIREAEIRGDTLITMLSIGEKNKNTGGFLHYSSFAKKNNNWFIKKSRIDPLRFYRVAIPNFLLTGKETNLGFLKQVKVIVTNEFSVNDPRHDIRLAVIQQLKKEKSR